MTDEPNVGGPVVDRLPERPEDLVVYGGTGKAARDWESFDRILATLRRIREQFEGVLHEHAVRVSLTAAVEIPVARATVVGVARQGLDERTDGVWVDREEGLPELLLGERARRQRAAEQRSEHQAARPAGQRS